MAPFSVILELNRLQCRQDARGDPGYHVPLRWGRHPHYGYKPWKPDYWVFSCSCCKFEYMGLLQEGAGNATAMPVFESVDMWSFESSQFEDVMPDGT